jgi:hypothetical protein
MGKMEPWKPAMPKAVGNISIYFILFSPSLSFFFFVFFFWCWGIEARALHLPGKCYTTELYFQPDFILTFILFFWERVFLCNSGWPRTHGPPASASWVLRLKARPLPFFALVIFQVGSCVFALTSLDLSPIFIPPA